MPIGTVVIRKREQGRRRRLARYIKIRNDGPPGRRWILYARWWWEKHRGPVPAGHNVLHRDGQELNDKPENLILGTPGMRLVLAHRRDPEMSARNRASASAGTAEFNRLSGKLHRLREFLGRYWYPVLDTHGVILNVPFRRRKTLMKWFKMDVAWYPKNGRAKKVVSRGVQETGIRPVRGGDFAHEHYQSYVKLDPEWDLPSGRSVMDGRSRQKLEALHETEAWKLAQVASKLDLSLRK
jgi:hypothetical protein